MPHRALPDSREQCVSCNTDRCEAEKQDKIEIKNCESQVAQIGRIGSVRKATAKEGYASSSCGHGSAECLRPHCHPFGRALCSIAREMETYIPMVTVNQAGVKCLLRGSSAAFAAKFNRTYLTTYSSDRLEATSCTALGVFVITREREKNRQQRGKKEQVGQRSLHLIYV